MCRIHLQNYKVTRTTVPFNVFDDKGNGPDTSINKIITDDVLFAFQSAGKMYHDDNEQDFREFFLIHTCIQSDPGDPVR